MDRPGRSPAVAWRHRRRRKGLQQGAERQRRAVDRATCSRRTGGNRPARRGRYGIGALTDNAGKLEGVKDKKGRVAEINAGSFFIQSLPSGRARAASPTLRAAFFA